MLCISLLVTAIAVLPLATATSCPYIAGNTGRSGAPISGRDAQNSDSTPFGHCTRKSNVAGGGTRSRDFWPCELPLAILSQNAAIVNPMGSDFDYASEFSKLDGRLPVIGVLLT